MDPTERVWVAFSTCCGLVTDFSLAYAAADPHPVVIIIVRDGQGPHQPILQAEPTRGRSKPAAISTTLGDGRRQATLFLD